MFLSQKYKSNQYNQLYKAREPPETVSVGANL